MNALVKFEIDKFAEWLIPQKLENQTAYIECLDKMQSKRYKDLHEVDSTDLLYECIKQVWRLRNVGIPSLDSVNYEIRQLNKELIKNKRYSNLTVEELAYVFNRGGLGKFNEGEFIKNEVFFSVSNYFSWIEKYYKTIRAQAEDLKSKYNKIHETELENIKSHQAYLDSLDRAVLVMQDWKNHTKYSVVVLASIFKMLRDCNLAIPTKEEYEDIALSGKAIYKNLAQQEKGLLSYNEQDFCRYLCLHHFYKKWKQQGKKLEIENEQLKLV